MSDQTKQTIDANTHLIAELLSVLKEALRQSGCDGDLCGYAWHDKARDVIAKAEASQ